MNVSFAYLENKFSDCRSAFNIVVLSSVDFSEYLYVAVMSSLSNEPGALVQISLPMP